MINNSTFNNIGIQLSKGTVEELITLLQGVDPQTRVTCCGDAKRPIVYYLTAQNVVDGGQCITIDYDIIQDRLSDNDIYVVPFENICRKVPKSGEKVTLELSYEFFCMVFPKITSLLNGELDDNPEAKLAMVNFIKEAYNIKFDQGFIDKANTFFELFRDEDPDVDYEEEYEEED